MRKDSTMETNLPEKAGETGTETPKTPNWGKRLAIGGISVAALAGVGVAGALSQDFCGERMRFGWGNGGPGMHMQASPAAFRGGMGFGGHGMGRILDRIDATDEQEDKIEAIMDKVHDDVRPIMRSFRDTREDLAELLGAATIDREALEKLRAERVAAIDQASRTVATALADAAEVLTPEQRKELLEHFEDRGWRGRW
jgi:periplasmic protein CpxP/Spy